MREAGGGKREAGSGKREAGSAQREEGPPPAFAGVMREWRMTAPTALSRSIDHALGIESLPTDAKRPARDLSAAARDSLQAAEQILDRVLAGACESRASALDLLTVDALVTRSMEIAARDPQLLADFPELAMKRLSAR